MQSSHQNAGRVSTVDGDGLDGQVGHKRWQRVILGNGFIMLASDEAGDDRHPVKYVKPQEKRFNYVARNCQTSSPHFTC